ncbi:MAG: hypothetical protein ACOYNI_09635 [Acidimicrobiia bacterium]
MTDASFEHDHQHRAGCPMCAFFETVSGAQPEVTEHLTSAAREFIRAGRALLDAADAAMERHYPESGVHIDLAAEHARESETPHDVEPEPRVQHIDVI